MSILIALMFLKFIYLASFTSYYTFYLMDKFALSTKAAKYVSVRVLRSRCIGNRRRGT